MFTQLTEASVDDFPVQLLKRSGSWQQGRGVSQYLIVKSKRQWPGCLYLKKIARKSPTGASCFLNNNHTISMITTYDCTEKNEAPRGGCNNIL